MTLLLDTHALIWFFAGDSQLSERSRIIIDDINNEKLISIASIWELAIKQSRGKLTLKIPLQEYIEQKIKLKDFKILPIQLNHLAVVTRLPFYHNDPFDRLLIAQSIVENISIINKDSFSTLMEYIRVGEDNLI